MAFGIVGRIGLMAAMAGLLAACAGGPPPPPKPTVAQIDITAAANANPDPSGRASPSVVFLYALKPGAPFATGNPDALTGGELGSLAESMSRIARVVAVPGNTTQKTFELPLGTAGIGIAVAYRNFNTAKWRASAPVKANEITPLKATVGASEVTIQ
jgi:type VI secretion system protein VasD